MLYFVKLLVSAGFIVLITEISKKNVHLGALIGSLPVVTLIIMAWMFYESEGGTTKRLQDYSIATFWYVLPSLIFFVIFPLCIGKMHFWWSMTLSGLATFLAYLAMIAVLARFGIKI